jgi:hypothetical protein
MSGLPTTQDFSRSATSQADQKARSGISHLSATVTWITDFQRHEI